MADEGKISFFKGSRKHVRTKVTTCSNQLPSNVNSFGIRECQSEIEKYKSFQKKLEDLNLSIGQISCEDKDFDIVSELEKCDEYEAKILGALSSLEERISAIQSSITSPNPFGYDNNSQVGGKIKLPELPLPLYSNQPDQSLERFFINFENIISKYNVNQFEKFVFLERQLSGSPLKLIKSLEGNQQSYTEAKKLLEEAFSNPILQRFEAIRRLVNLKYSLTDPFEYISEMRSVCNVFDTLQIDRDIIMQFFIWQSLPESMQSMLISITNTNKPTVKQISENIFKAVERHRPLSAVKSKIYSTNLAVNIPSVELKGKNCILCPGESNHVTYKCTNYAKPRDKVNRIKSLGGCIKCAGTSHKSNECKFTFKKECFHCKGQHFAYLCLSRKNPQNKIENSSVNQVNVLSSDEAEESYENVSQMMVNFQSLNSNSSPSKTILPTFSCNLAGGTKISCLRDTGCQGNFISKNTFLKEKFKVVAKTSIKINGFNACQIYNTCIVEVCLILNSRKCIVRAIVVPSIGTYISLPGLSKVVRTFKTLGYRVADQFLGDEDSINGFDFLLGTESSYCLPENNVVFGKNRNCMFSNTDIGVLLYGNIDEILANASHIPQPLKMSNCEGPLMKSGSAWKSPNPLEKFDSLDALELPYMESSISVNFCVTNENGTLVASELEKALKHSLYGENMESVLEQFDDYNKPVSASFTEENKELLNNGLDNLKVLDNRITMSMFWNSKNCHLLGKNFHLSKLILENFKKKFSKDRSKMFMVDEVFKTQEKSGIIEKIPNLEVFMKETPSCSFIPHMPVFRMEKSSTKCRPVFMCNLSERTRSGVSLSMNQCLKGGPNLNKNLSTTLIQLRFDSKILSFDLVKAFSQIKLTDSDSKKMCFLWFRDVSKNDYSVIGYLSKRLPFGLRNSPSILMISLYYILMVVKSGSSFIDRVKKSLWDLIYMDNASITANSSVDLVNAYNVLNSIFSPYGFQLQQYLTNDRGLRNLLDEKGEPKEENPKLLGLPWNPEKDEFVTPQFRLDEAANTKRKILQSIASNYDIFGIASPLLNRSRLFVHSLQCRPDLGWDVIISPEEVRVWRNICREVNNSKPVSISRSVGGRKETYKLVAFTDSSTKIYGVVIYLFNLKNRTMSFLLGKNRIVSKSMSSRTVPCLELQAVEFGVKTLIDVYKQLAGPTCVVPINILELNLFTDSIVCLHWMINYGIKFEKTSKLPIFVLNRLKNISECSEVAPIKFMFCEGIRNPADNITRNISYRKFVKSNYLSGVKEIPDEGYPSVVLPSLDVNPDQSLTCGAVVVGDDTLRQSVIDLSRHSSLSKAVRVLMQVTKAAAKFKKVVGWQDDSRADGVTYNDAFKILVLDHQRENFENVFRYFREVDSGKTPSLVDKLNLFPDMEGILRVKSKLRKWRCGDAYPILIAPKTHFSKLIILALHKGLAHAGTYTILAELKSKYYIPCIFSEVKSVLKGCILCQRLNNRKIALNQNVYRDFRLAPPEIPFRFVFLDYIGPIWCRQNGNKTKIYLLLFTCMWSRGISLKVCSDLTVNSFLRGFQLFIFDHGLPERCYSDSGSQLIPGGQVIGKVMDDCETKKYLTQQGIKSFEFIHYPKGCNKLGSLVESCVKLVRRLIFGSVRNLVLDYKDFEFMVAHVKHIVNRRPIAFREALRDCTTEKIIPSAITPEILLFGRELTSVNVIPNLEKNPEDDGDWVEREDATEIITRNYGKLIKARKYLQELYNKEFLPGLIEQATCRKNLYKHRKHVRLKKGDLVLVAEQHVKRTDYPLGKIIETTENDLKEVVSVRLKKGDTGEIVRRHVESLIPLFSEMNSEEDTEELPGSVSQSAHGHSKDDHIDMNVSRRPSRRAASKASAKIKHLFKEGAL